MDLFNSCEDLGDTLNIRVTTNASSNRVKYEHRVDGSTLIRVYITTSAEKGKANREVIDMLAKELGLAKSSLAIISGEFIRDKVIQITK